MKTTQKIKLDFNLQGTTPRIQAVQGDLYTRMVEISLYSNKAPWEIPEDAAVLIRYRKPDRTVGAYDTLPNGDLAYHLEGNAVTIAIAPDVLMVPGDASLIVTLIAGEQVLSAFEIVLEVQPNHGTGSPSEGAGSCISGILPGPETAQEGQILAVEEITPNGSIKRLRAMDLPYYNSVKSIAADTGASTEAETVYRITMSDGAEHTFTVKNGSSGKDGTSGTDGKSAYAYAQEGGYTKSEEDFAKKLADETPPALYIAIAQGEGNQQTTENGIVIPIVSDATFEDILNAVMAGRSVYANTIFGTLSLAAVDTSNSMAVFRVVMKDSDALLFGSAYVGQDGTGSATIEYMMFPNRLPSPGSLYIGSSSYDGSETVVMTKAINDMITAKLPTKLPNPQKLILTGAVSAEYDGSGAVTVEIPTAGTDVETETVLSDNLLDLSLLTKGQTFYYGSSGYQLANSTYSHYAFVPLRGTGTYRTKFQKSVHSSTDTRIALVNDANTWVVNVTGTCAETGEDGNWVDFEFIVTEAHIAAGATKVAFDVYEPFINRTMIVKNRDYPSEYIPFGYIEVATDSGRKQNNVLSGKTAVFLGDSICAGTTVAVNSGCYGYGWGGIIGEENHMNWTNYGINGGTVSHRGSDGTCIAKIADSAIAEHPAADYIIFEGGCNDADQMREDGLGEISDDYETFDTTTFSGALESLILKLVSAYPQGKLGYIIPQKMYTGYVDYTATNHIHRKYFDQAAKICLKWGIPVIDIWNTTPLNPKLPTATIYYVEENGQHLTEAGYRRITPLIEAWMRAL